MAIRLTTNPLFTALNSSVHIIKYGLVRGQLKSNLTQYILSDKATLFKTSKETKELDFYVAINIPQDLNMQPAYHRTVITRLVSGREKNISVKWYALGEANHREEQGVIVAEIDNLDHVFIERI